MRVHLLVLKHPNLAAQRGYQDRLPVQFRDQEVSALELHQRALGQHHAALQAPIAFHGHHFLDRRHPALSQRMEQAATVTRRPGQA